MTVPRDSVAADRTWDAASVFPTVEAWEAELEAVLADLAGLAAFSGRLGESAARARRSPAGPRRDHCSARAGSSSTRCSGTPSRRPTRPRSRASAARRRPTRRCRAAVAFVEPEVLAVGAERLRDWAAGDPALAAYDHYLADLGRRAAHTRSGEVEEVLGLVSDVFAGPFGVYSALTDSDVVFAPAVSADGAQVEVTQGSIDMLLASADRTLRRSAWESYADGYLGVRNSLAANLSGTIKQAVFQARVRRYESPLAASLSRSNVPVEVFDNLIATFEANLPTWHRYWRLRQRIHGVDRLAPYDLAAPLGASSPELDYEQCVEWICASLEPLGATYADTVRRGCLEERWVDVYPTAGKMGGAFSAGCAGNGAVHRDELRRDGREPRHARARARPLDALVPHAGSRSRRSTRHYSMFVAEVASNFHQAMLRAYMLETVADPALQLAVLEEAMANFRRYFFIMPTLARLERELHERVARGEGLTAELLGDRMADLFAEGYGPDVEVDRARVGITWAEFGHLYEPFYVYQYATGISGAHALARGVLDGDDGAAARYLEFLSAGDSLYPLDALRRAGVDLRSPEPVEQTFAVLASLVDRIEELV